MFSLPGTFFPSPFPVLPDLGMAAPYCSSSAATSLEGHSLTVLSKASPLPHSLYPAFLHLGSSSKPQNTEDGQVTISQLSQLVQYCMPRSIVNSSCTRDA